MKNKLIKGFSALAIMTLLPAHVWLPVVPVTQVEALSEEQPETMTWMSLGASLTDQQATMTQQLLNGTHVSRNHTIHVDGPMVNHYLNDGSTAQTQVYSSALIEPQAANYGVQVQIVTPQHIQQVSAATYQNAAITAGASDVLIRVAAIAPVTGEGALAGVYALLEAAGQTIEQEDAQRAQKEIIIINDIETQETNVNVNVLIANIKIFVVNELQAGRDPAIALEDQLRELLENQGLAADDVEELLNNEEFMEMILELINNFKESAAAQDEATADQLEKSINQDMGRPWSDVLVSLDDEFTLEELQALEHDDYSDETMYHPIIPAMFAALDAQIENNEPINDLYSHTFVLEEMQPNLAPQEVQAVNRLRSIWYYYLLQAIDFQPELKNDLLVMDDYFKQLMQADPIAATIIQRIMIATGLAPQQFAFLAQLETADTYVYDIRDNYSHMDTGSTRGLFGYDLASQVVFQEEGDGRREVPSSVDFASLYGVAVDDESLPYAELTTETPETDVPESEESSILEIEEAFDEEISLMEELMTEEISTEEESITEELSIEEELMTDYEESMMIDDETSLESLEDLEVESSLAEDESTQVVTEESLVEASLEESGLELMEESVEESELTVSPTAPSFTVDDQLRLDDYVLNEWGPELGQNYVADPGDGSLTYYDLTVQEIIQRAVDGSGIPFADTEDAEATTDDLNNVVAAYATTTDPEQSHLYLFAIRDGEGLVYVLSGALDETSDVLEFKLTENAAIQAFFTELMNH